MGGLRVHNCCNWQILFKKYTKSRLSKKKTAIWYRSVSFYWIINEKYRAAQRKKKGGWKKNRALDRNRICLVSKRQKKKRSKQRHCTKKRRAKNRRRKNIQTSVFLQGVCNQKRNHFPLDRALTPEAKHKKYIPFFKKK